MHIFASFIHPSIIPWALARWCPMPVWLSISTVHDPVQSYRESLCPSGTILWCHTTTPYLVFLSVSVPPWPQTPHPSPVTCLPSCRYVQTGWASSPWWVVQCSSCFQLVFAPPHLMPVNVQDSFHLISSANSKSLYFFLNVSQAYSNTLITHVLIMLLLVSVLKCLLFHIVLNPAITSVALTILFYSAATQSPTEAKQGWAWSVPGWKTSWENLLLLEEVLVTPTGGAHPVVCVGPNAPV